MASDSQALARKADMELMPPPPPAKRIKRPPKVLDEDTYTDALSEIIARDFFPGLLETKHQQEYLSALASHDLSRIAEASRRLAEVMTTPRLRRGTSFSTPLHSRGSDTPLKSNPMAPAAGEDTGPTAYEKHLSLDAFQAKYTSEDNASFNTLLDKQNEKKRNAYAFLWAGNRIPGFRATAEAKRLKARADADAANGGPQKSLAWTDDRKAVPNTWKAVPRNTLMFAPEGAAAAAANDNDDAAAPTSQNAAKDLPPKSVVYANTRMPPPALPPPPPSPSFSAVRDAIAGRPRPLPSESGFGGAETPRVNGYSFVKDAPSPSPSELGAPPLTWGSIAAITDMEAAPTPFKIAPTPRRELLHHRMVDRVAKNKRPVAGRAATPRREGAAGTPGLTPAGQRLWSSLAGRGEGERWKATPRAGGRGVATPRVGAGGGRGIATPLVKRK